MPGAPCGGELRWGLVSKCAVRASLVVSQAPSTNDLSSLRKRSKPVLVEALVAKLAVETLHIGVLRRFARLDQPQLDAALIGPLIERLAGELRALIGSNRARQTSESRRLVEHSRHVSFGSRPAVAYLGAPAV